MLNDIPFSIPPYFAILGRAIVTLEGVALTGDENYGLIMEAYPFIARKLLREDRPELQRALQQVLYSSEEGAKLKFTRLFALLNNAAGSISRQVGGAFVDLDNVPEDGLSFAEGFQFVLSDKAESLRYLLEKELDTVVDIMSRQFIRKGVNEALITIAPPRLPTLPLIGNILPSPPNVDKIPLPLLLPSVGGNANAPPSIALMTLSDFVDTLAPPLRRDEELYAISLAEGAEEFFGDDVAQFVRGDSVLSRKSGQMILSAVQSGIFGRQDFLKSSGVQSVISGLTTLLEGRPGEKMRNGVDEALDEMNSRLSNVERMRLDAIISELTQRGLKRVSQRLADVPRLL